MKLAQESASNKLSKSLHQTFFGRLLLFFNSSYVIVKTYLYISVPKTLSFCPIFILDAPLAMPHVIHPLSNISFTIFPFVAAVPFFLIHYILAFIFFSIRPFVISSPMHTALIPFSFVLSPIV